jgi:8-oxo-dGTP pyrophosphatase MutT (NUDIX family)
VTTFENGKVSFRCRAAGVIIHNGAVLLQGEPEGIFWTLPGGGIEPLESSQAALAREMREQLGISIHIERLLWNVEHFFIADTDDKAHHGIGFYYLVTPLNAPHLYNLEQTFQAVEAGEEREIIFRWCKLADLSNIALYPSFLPTALQRLPLTPEHVIFDEIA